VWLEALLASYDMVRADLFPKKKQKDSEYMTGGVTSADADTTNHTASIKRKVAATHSLRRLAALSP
jgi:hypothetical protein